MNRQILFRGKRLDNGEWIYGDLQLGDGDHIPMIGVVRGGHDPDYYQVEEATVGQFTGLRDKDSRPIYEGDIVEAYDLDEELAFMGAVRYALPDAAFGIDKGTGASLEPFEGNMTYKVVGNFHDNIESLNCK
ncbi:YopX family protein [uncultured Duncaniella sp.]|uniref:YopX family protein n=1 Tax=uncultured Duncaniella sp. TaxID=2768039 RepID=UPI0022C28F46|nr:YopX family protein [uncultured Duncaniella sp.]MCZ2855537.1 YopX family protein [Candidatus Bathyarchaeota archaeon]